jgi:hypothetical protein
LADSRLARDTVAGGTFDPTLAGGLEAGWRARLSTFETSPAPAPGELSLERIELEVWWMSGPQRRTFTLDTYRRRVLRAEDIAPGAPQ